MSLKTYNIDVPITPGVMPPVIHIGQYDSGREYIAHLKNDDGTDYTIPANSTATFTGCNPRKEVFEIEATVGETTVTFQPSDEATSMWGKYGATINITSGGEKMSPIVLLMDVQKAGATDEEIAGAANFPDAVTEAVNDFLEEALEEGDLGSLYVTKAAQIPATEGMTQPVGITPEGALVTAPGGGGEAAVTPASIVTATGQMTTAQKTSTRNNINAAPATNIAKSALASEVQTSLDHADKSVRFDLTQGLTDTQKATARANIGAGTLSEVTAEDILGAAEDFTAAQQGVMRGYIGAASTDALTAYIPKSAQGAKTVNDTQEIHIDGNGKLWTQPGGGGDTPVVVENTQLITMTYAAGDTYASMTAAQIYAALQDGAVNFVLIDRSGRECALDYPPEDETDVAKFYTYDEGNTEIIVYTVSANGIVTDTTRHVGTYDKPGTGIPQTDLATAVSNKINGALQTSNLPASPASWTQAVGYRASDGTLWTAPGSGGGSGGSDVPQTIVVSVDTSGGGGPVATLENTTGQGLSFSAVRSMLSAGPVNVVTYIDQSLQAGFNWYFGGFDGAGNNRVLRMFALIDNGTAGYMLYMADLDENQNGVITGSMSSQTVGTGNANNPTAQSKTAAQIASGVYVSGNIIYTVSGEATGFTITNSALPTMTLGTCIEIRLTTGSSAITTPTWPSWAKMMNGWDGNFSANTYYDIIIDDAGNVYAGTREVSA